MPTVDLYEHFINVEGIAVSSVLSLQSSSIYSSEFDAPQPDGFVADGDATFSEQVFNIPMTQIESIVEPNRIANDIWRESVSFISILETILAIWVT